MMILHEFCTPKNRIYDILLDFHVIRVRCVNADVLKFVTIFVILIKYEINGLNYQNSASNNSNVTVQFRNEKELCIFDELIELNHSP